MTSPSEKNSFRLSSVGARVALPSGTARSRRAWAKAGPVMAKPAARAKAERKGLRMMSVPDATTHAANAGAVRGKDTRASGFIPAGLAADELGRAAWRERGGSKGVVPGVRVTI